MKNALPEIFPWDHREDSSLTYASGLTLGGTDGYDELKCHVVRMPVAGAHVWEALLFLNGYQLHMSEHATRGGATRACERAARRAFRLRWAP